MLKHIQFPGFQKRDYGTVANNIYETETTCSASCPECYGNDPIYSSKTSYTVSTIVIPFYKERNGRAKGLSKLLKITQLISDRTRIPSPVRDFKT